MGPLPRLVVSVAMAFGSAFVVAVAVAIIDLYLTGHGYGSVTRESVSEPPWGVHVSIGDIVLLVAAAATGGITWWLLPRRSSSS